MAKRSRQKKEQPAPAAESLPEDLLVEVLARVPYRSLCRFKCVSKPWLALCSDPCLRKRSPQALSGFFCYTRSDWKNELRFRNLSGRGRPLVDPGLPFLRGAWDGGVQTVDCCGGLLLCECWKRSSATSSDADTDYVVCNPATEEWTVLPAKKELLQPRNIVRLGFDPAAPSCFAVFVLVRGNGITRVEIFSSETGRWTSKESEWGDRTNVDDHNGSVSLFFGSALHLTTHDSSVITVDAEGNTWRKIQIPLTVEDTSDCGYIGQSLGRLYAIHMDYCNGNCQLSVWVLEDYASGQWTLKHTANMSELIGHDEVCTFVAFGPECKSIFFQINGLNERLVSYDVENRRSRAIFSFGKSHYDLRCKPYIPSYMEWLSDGC